MPAENLITPEFVRRICWDQTQAKLEVVQEKLKKLGARPWQIEQVAPVLVGALTQTQPLVVESTDEPEPQEGGASNE